MEWLAKRELNRPFHEDIFNFYSGGSLFLYLCHDLWITVIATYVIQPNLASENSEGMPFALALAVMIVGTELLGNLNYYVFTSMFACCSRNSGKGRGSADKEGAQRVDGGKVNASMMAEDSEAVNKTGLNQSQNINGD